MSTPCRATFCPFIYACMVCLSILLALPPSLSLFLCRFLLIFLFFFFKSDNHSPLSGCQVSLWPRICVSVSVCENDTTHTHTVAQLYYSSTATAGYGYRALELKLRLKLKLRNCFRGCRGRATLVFAAPAQIKLASTKQQVSRVKNWVKFCAFLQLYIAQLVDEISAL